MRQFTFILMTILAVGLVVWLWWGDQSRNSQPTTEETEPTDQASSTPATSTTPLADWVTYAAPIATGTTLSVIHPPASQVNRVQSGIVEIKYIGPESEPNTEITDGYYIAIQFIPDVQFDPYVANQQVVGEIIDTTWKEQPAVRYQTTSQLGNQTVRHLVVPVAAQQAGVIDISYDTYGSQANVYEETVDTIIANVEILISTTTGEAAEEITVTSPVADATVTSPITVTGEARGNWFFEATAPVVVTNWDGLIIGEGYITAEGDWMTSDWVPFTGSVSYEQATGTPYQNGTVIFQKANPSGLLENDAAVEIPVLLE